MKYVYVLLDTETGASQTVFATNDREAARRFAVSIRSAAHAAGGEPFRLPSPLQPPASGRPARRVKVVASLLPEIPVGTEFPSMMDASVCLACNPQSLTSAFSTAKHAGNSEATLRGVTFQKI